MGSWLARKGGRQEINGKGRRAKIIAICRQHGRNKGMLREEGTGRVDSK